MEGKNKLNLENQMEIFIKTEIKSLWPEGWMSLSALLKLYNNFSEMKKQVDTTNVNKKLALKPSLNSNSTPAITCTKELQKIASNSTLSIIPVGPNKINADNTLKNDIVIDKILKNDTSSNKVRKPLPIDISKTSNSLIITPTTSTNIVNIPINEERKIYHEPKKSIINEVIILEEKPKKSVIEPVSQHNNSDIVKKIDNKHCQIIDLTDNSEIKKKSIPKIKMKYYEPEDKTKPNDLKNEKLEVTASSAYNSLIKESLSDVNRFAQNLKSAPPTTTVTNKLTDHSIKKLSTPSNYSNSVEHMKIKPSNEGDEIQIQRVMEGLKALQNMSTPVKTESATSSPVSVISFNKGHTKTNNIPTPPSTFAKSEYNSGFQEVFQRQLLNDFHMIKGSSVGQSTPTSSKSHYNNRCS